MIADLRAALEKPDSETEPASEQFEPAADIRHVTAAANTTATIPTPVNTATPAIYQTTTTTTTYTPTNTAPPTYETKATPEPLDHVEDVRHITTPPTPAPVPIPVLPLTLTTTTAAYPDATITDGVITVATAATVKLQHENEESKKGEFQGSKLNEENEETREAEEERERSAEREGSEIVETRGDEGVEEEQIACSASAKEGENEDKREIASEGIEESQCEVQGDPPPPTAHPAPVATVHEPQRFDWTTNDDQSIGPVPSAHDFCPNKPPSPLASPIPAHHPPDNPVMPSQPIRPHTPATGAPSDWIPAAYTPAPPIVHGPRDLSVLCSGSRNPWGSLSHRRSHIHPPCNLSSLCLSTSNPWSSL